MLPALEGAEPIASYAGLRPAGRGRNYVIGPSPACPRLINVAAIRSTGLSASLGIAEHVVGAARRRRASSSAPSVELPRGRAGPRPTTRGGAAPRVGGSAV